MGYLIHTYAISHQLLFINKAPDGVFVLSTSEMSSTMMDTLPPSICEKCGGKRTTLHGTILVEQQRYDIRQSTFDIRDWILLHISSVLVVWGYLEDPILVDVQNEHMICTKCYVVSSPGIK